MRVLYLFLSVPTWTISSGWCSLQIHRSAGFFLLLFCLWSRVSLVCISRHSYPGSPLIRGIVKLISLSPSVSRAGVIAQRVSSHWVLLENLFDFLCENILTHRLCYSWFMYSPSKWVSLMHIFFLSQGRENAKCLMHRISPHQAAGDRSAVQFAFCTHFCCVLRELQREVPAN